PASARHRSPPCSSRTWVPTSSASCVPARRASNRTTSSSGADAWSLSISNRALASKAHCSLSSEPTRSSKAFGPAGVDASSSGPGRLLGAAIGDGTASLLTFIYAALARGEWRDERGGNLLDGGAPFYTTYRCADGEYIAVGALEPQFHEVLIARLGLDQEAFKDRLNPQSWPRLRQLLQQTFSQRTRLEWRDLLEGTD